MLVPLIKKEIIPASFPTDLLIHAIGKFLDLSDMAQLAETNKFYNSLFQPRLSVIPLLVHVARGQQDEADVLLTKHPELLLERGDVTDYSGRSFVSISPLEYAYWAMDTHMCRMLEQHLMALEPTRCEKTKAIMLKRLNKIEEYGLTYKQYGVVVEHSKHFDFSPLITALRRYIAGFHNWCALRNYDAINAAWMAVGIAQRDMPVHVVNEYCFPNRLFDPRPAFNERVMPRNVEFFKDMTTSLSPLFPLVISDSSGLGVDFALVRGGRWCNGNPLLTARGDSGSDVGFLRVPIDLAAMSHLAEIRKADLASFLQVLLPTDLESSHSMSV